MKRFFLLFFIFFIPSVASSEFFNIKEYNVDISIKRTGELEVKEDILVNFSSPRHGIIREIPLSYSNIKGQKENIYIYDVNVIGDKHSVSKRDGYLLIKIGDKNSFVSGEKRYKIHYSLFGAISYFNDFDSFYFNVIGDEWDVDIYKVNFFIFFPKGLTIKEEDLAVFSGNKRADVSVSIDGSMIYGKSENPLKKGEGIIVSAFLPKGFIQPSLNSKVLIVLKENKVFLLPIIAFLIIFTIWWVVGKDETISRVIHYRPPKDLNPAIAGYLFNDRADNRDLISLLFYWAKEGIIKIEEVDDPLSIIFSKKDYVLKQIKTLPSDSKPFEWIIFNDLFPYHLKVVRIGSLKDKFYTTMERARRELENYVNTMDLYNKGSREMGRILKILSIPIFFIGVYLGFLEDIKVAISVISISGIFLLFSLIMPKKSPYGNRIYEILRGFKDFLEKVEKPRLQRMIAKEPGYFDDILPFAIAFGIADKLAGKFEGLFSKPPEWYGGNSRDYEFYNFISNIDIIVGDFNNLFGSKESSESNVDFGFSDGGAGGGGGSSW